MLLHNEGIMENYYCYFELNFDSGESNGVSIDYSMGGIPMRLAFNSDRLLSYLLLFYLISHKNFNIEDIVFIAKNGIAWKVIELNSDLCLITDNGDVSVGIFDQISLPTLDYALFDYQKVYLSEVKIIDQIHFDSLKNMYEPNFNIIA
jgi:hypothetical protein